MKALILNFLILVIFTIITLVGYSQNVTTLEFKPETCCQHYNDEFGETWTILYYATDILDAQRLVGRYDVLDIGNDYFESNGSYYLELVDPSDTLEIRGNFKLFPDRYKKRLIYIDFLVTDNNEVLYDSDGNKIMFR